MKIVCSPFSHIGCKVEVPVGSCSRSVGACRSRTEAFFQKIITAFGLQTHAPCNETLRPAGLKTEGRSILGAPGLVAGAPRVEPAVFTARGAFPLDFRGQPASGPAGVS